MPIIDTKHLTKESMQNYLNNKNNSSTVSLENEVEDLLLWRRTHGVNKLRDFLSSIQNDSLRELIDSLVNPTNINGNSNDYYVNIHNKLDAIESMQQDVRDELVTVKVRLNERR